MTEQREYNIKQEAAEALEMLGKGYARGWDKPIEIVDDGDLRKYRIELPNLYDDSNLDPYEFRLLAHYKRVGNCTEGTRTTAKICRMAPSVVSTKRQALRKKGFIRMEKVQKSEYEYSYRITVIDRWQENFSTYATRSPHEPPRSPHEPPRSPHRDKETTTTALNIFALYESNIGPLTPMIANSLEDAEKTYPPEWIKDAIGLAVENNKRNWRYCETILKRWQASGKDDGKGKPKKTDEAHPEYQTDVPEKRNYVPRPAGMPRPNIKQASQTSD